MSGKDGITQKQYNDALTEMKRLEKIGIVSWHLIEDKSTGKFRSTFEIYKDLERVVEQYESLHKK